MCDLDVDNISLNARGLRDFTKRRKVRRGIIFLQETHTVRKVEKLWTNQFLLSKRYSNFSHGKSDAKGVLMAFLEQVKVKIIEKYLYFET